MRSHWYLAWQYRSHTYTFSTGP